MNSELQILQNGTMTEIANRLIKARFNVTEAGVKQEFFARADDSWILVATSFRPQLPRPADGLPLNDASLAPEHRLVVADSLNTVQNVVHENDSVLVILTGSTGSHHIEQ